MMNANMPHIRNPIHQAPIHLGLSGVMPKLENKTFFLFSRNLQIRRHFLFIFLRAEQRGHAYTTVAHIDKYKNKNKTYW